MPQKVIEDVTSEIVVKAKRTVGTISRALTVTNRAINTAFNTARDVMITPACGCAANSLENKQANDAKRRAERVVGTRMSRSQERRFHDNITGQGLGYHDLVREAIFILTGQW